MRMSPFKTQVVLSVLPSGSTREIGAQGNEFANPRWAILHDCFHNVWMTQSCSGDQSVLDMVSKRVVCAPHRRNSTLGIRRVTFREAIFRHDRHRATCGSLKGEA